MTTIIYQNGKMYADSRAYSGDNTPIGEKNKIHVLSDGSLVGVSTPKVGEAERFVAWLNSLGGDFTHAQDNPEVFDLAALVVRPNGDVYLFSDSRYPSGPIIADYYVIGSGERYAIGALEAGAGADKALAIACKCDVYSAEPMTWRNLNAKIDREAH